MNRILFMLLFLFFTVPFCGAQNTKRAFNLMEKQEYEKVISMIDKAIEKDSINPTAYYLSSVLHLIDSFPGYDLQKGYAEILVARSQYQNLDDKAIDKLEKDDIYAFTLEKQKSDIDSLAFLVAKQINTEDGFNEFLKIHNTASQTDQAKVLRNELAFGTAKSIDTYNSYRNFMDTYPEAIQIGEANKLYDKRLFEAETKEKTLKNYQRFLSEYPETPFRPQLERQIFEMMTIDHTVANYHSFVKQFPSGQMTKRAVDYLYYLLLENQNSIENIWSLIPQNQYIDSLIEVNQVAHINFIPIYDKNKYLLIDENGIIQVPFQITDRIDPVYLCSGANSDFVFSFNDSLGTIENKLGEVLFQGNISMAKPLSTDLINISKHNKSGAIHRAGWDVIDIAFDNIQPLGKKYLKVELNGQLGLFSIAGREILAPEYQSIEMEKGFILITKDDKLAIANQSTIRKAVQDDTLNLQFIYTDFEVVNENFIIAINENQEALLNVHLEEVIPMDRHEIYEKAYGWMALQDQKLFHYNPEYQLVYEREYQSLISKSSLDAFKSGDQWFLLRTGDYGVDVLNYDSLYIGNERITYSEKHEYLSLMFDNTVELEVATHQSVRFIQSSIHNIDSLNEAYAIVIDPRRKTQAVYNATGRRMFSLKNISVTNVYDSLFVTEYRGKKGLVSKSGKKLWDHRYNAIAYNDKGYFSLLQSNNFGLYAPKLNISIPTIYSSKLSFYNEQLIIASKSGLYGIIDKNNKEVIPFEFEEISYWNDTLALVYIDTRWQLYNIYEKAMVIDHILKYEVITSNNEKWAIIHTDTGFGVIHEEKGVIIGPTFTDLNQVGTNGQFIFFCEKYVSEANIYVVVYYDKYGKNLRNHVFKGQDYDKIYCDQ